jgi:glutamate synthase domain-containing protein 2
LIWEIGSGYFGCRDEQGRFDPDGFARQAQEPQVKMIEIKLSQGAKPGHGGVLPAAKMTAGNCTSTWRPCRSRLRFACSAQRVLQP